MSQTQHKISNSSSKCSKSASTSPGEKAAVGLARVGSRAALSFAFAFLRRAWRSGEDQDLCSELLSESLEALQALPEASLFHTENVSKVWLEVVERATKFLHQVVHGQMAPSQVAGHPPSGPPVEDRHLALALLCELAVQRANLSDMLSNVMLLLRLWNSRWDFFQFSKTTKGRPASINNNIRPKSFINHESALGPVDWRVICYMYVFLHFS